MPRHLLWLRPALTLVELLVVVAIAALLLGATLPQLKPALDDRKMREAARIVQGAITLAKARAAETGRPTAIWMERKGLAYGVQIYLAETPLPYSGDDLSGYAYLKELTAPLVGSADSVLLHPANTTLVSPLPTSLVRANDLIRFDYRGPLYRIVLISTVTASTSPTATIAMPPPYPGFAGTWFTGSTKPMTQIRFQALTSSPDKGPRLTNAWVRFQVFRQPIRSLSPPIEMPRGTMVDFDFSGLESSGIEFRQLMPSPAPPATAPPMPEGPVKIVFSPDGSIQSTDPGIRNWVSGAWVFAPLIFKTSDIHLLIGRIDRSGSSGESNLASAGSYWITIRAKAGTVLTAENVAQTAPATGYTATEYRNARQFALEGSASGGR